MAPMLRSSRPRRPGIFDGDQLLSMILQDCAPSLRRRRFAAAHHVFADAGLTDVDAELEQLTVDPWCTPKWILPAHPADQISDLTGNDRYVIAVGRAAPSTSRKHESPCDARPRPFRPRRGPAPSASRSRCGRARPIISDPLELILVIFSGIAEARRFGGAKQILQLERSARMEDRRQSCEERCERNEHWLQRGDR